MKNKDEIKADALERLEALIRLMTRLMMGIRRDGFREAHRDIREFRGCWRKLGRLMVEGEEARVRERPAPNVAENEIDEAMGKMPAPTPEGD